MIFQPNENQSGNAKKWKETFAYWNWKDCQGKHRNKELEKHLAGKDKGYNRRN